MPAPPYSSGMVGPKTPSSASSEVSSMGNVPFSQCSMIRGMKRSLTQERTASRTMSSSSEY